MMCPYSRANGSVGISCNKSCARYDSVNEQCVDVSIAQNLTRALSHIATSLEKLANPMLFTSCKEKPETGGETDGRK